MPLAIWMCQMTEKHAVCAHKPICVQDFDKWIDLISRFHSRKFSLFSIFYWENIFSCFTISAINVKCFIKSDISIVAFQLFEKRKLEKIRTHSLTTSVELLFSILHFPIECIYIKFSIGVPYLHWKSPWTESKWRNKWNRKTNLARMKNDQIKTNYIIL